MFFYILYFTRYVVGFWQNVLRATFPMTSPIGEGLVDRRALLQSPQDVAKNIFHIGFSRNSVIGNIALIRGYSQLIAQKYPTVHHYLSHSL